MRARGTAAEQNGHHSYEIVLDPFIVPAVTHTLAAAPRRARVAVEGRVGSVTPVTWVGGPVTEVTLVDDTDVITLVFFGRRPIGGVEPGRHLVVAGTVGTRGDRRVILSPQLWLAPVDGPGGFEPAEPAEPAEDGVAASLMASL
jgi:hypothetical protein